MRTERERRMGHDMRAHLGSEVHMYLARSWLGRGAPKELDRESIEKRISDAKRTLAK